MVAVCKQCQKEFKSEFNLKRHIKLEHPELCESQDKELARLKQKLGWSIREFAPKELFALFGVKFANPVRGFNGLNQFTPKIDPGYVFPPRATEEALLSIGSNEPIMLSGPAGTGKTTLIMQVAARLNYPVIRTQHHEQIEVPDILGEMILKDGGTEFIPGPLLVAMQGGYLYLCDEWDMAPPGIQSIYHAVAEKQQDGRLGSVFTTRRGEAEAINAHPMFRIAVTGNTCGLGDMTGHYSGTQVQNMALVSRFLIKTIMGYLPEAVEVEILTKKYPSLSAKENKALVTVAGKIRDAQANQRISVGFSVRDLLNWADKYLVFADPYRAMEVACSAVLTEQERSLVFEVIQRVFGVDKQGR